MSTSSSKKSTSQRYNWSDKGSSLKLDQDQWYELVNAGFNRRLGPGPGFGLN